MSRTPALLVLLGLVLVGIHSIAMGETDKPVVFVVMSDSRPVFTNKFAYSIVILDGLTNDVLDTIPLEESADDIAISPTRDLAYVASDGGNEVIAVDLGTATIVSRIKLKNSMGVAFGVDGKQAYVTQYPSSIAIVDTSSHIVVNTLTGIPSPMYIAASPDGSRAYITYSDGIAVLDIESSELVDSVKLTNPSGLAISPDGSVVYASNASQKVIIAIDSASNKVSKRLNVGRWPGRLAVAPDGGELLVLDSLAQVVHVIDTTTFKRIRSVRLPGEYLRAMDISPDGKFVYVTNGHYMDGTVGAVFVIEIASRKVVATIPMVDNNPSDVAAALVSVQSKQ
jgi:DNA-binding beta-propeller fold protein YncE